MTPITTRSYDVGVLLGLKGFAAAILGGFGSFSGAILGGLILGLLKSLGEQRLQRRHRLRGAAGSVHPCPGGY